VVQAEVCSSLITGEERLPNGQEKLTEATILPPPNVFSAH
jgi:hypothetical protein